MLKPREIEKLSGRPRLLVWLIALASGPLLTLTIPPFDVPGLVLFALAPLLLALPRLSAGGSWVAGFLVGMCYFWINLWWMGQMGTEPGNEMAIFSMFAFVATAMAAYYGLCAVFMRWALTRQAAWAAGLVPLIWLGFEFIHEFDTPGPFPWLSLSQGTLALTPLIQTADIWGSYGLVLIVLLCSVGLAAPFELAGSRAAFSLKRAGLTRFALPGAAVLVLLTSCIYGWARMAEFESRELKDAPLIGCVQGNLKQEVKVSNDLDLIPKAFAKHVEFSYRAKKLGAELIVWPETMVFGGATRDGHSFRYPRASQSFYVDGKPVVQLLGSVNSYGGYIGRLRAEIYYRLNTPMLVGALTPVPAQEQFDVAWKDYNTRVYNTAILLNEEGMPLDSYDKRFLVPGGEYIPLERNSLVQAIVQAYSHSLQGRSRFLEPGVRFTLFKLPAKKDSPAGMAGRDWRFTSSICYEFAWPQAFVDLHRRSDGAYPDFHLNISNEGWFRQSSELDQAVNYCRLRCIESRVPMVRCTNTGISCTIDAAGRVREVLTVNGSDREVEGVFMSRPPVLENPGPTIFIAWVGRAPAYLSLAAIIAIMGLMLAGRVALFRQRRREKTA